MTAFSLDGRIQYTDVFHLKHVAVYNVSSLNISTDGPYISLGMNGDVNNSSLHP